MEFRERENRDILSGGFCACACACREIDGCYFF